MPRHNQATSTCCTSASPATAAGFHGKDMPLTRHQDQRQPRYGCRLPWQRYAAYPPPGPRPGGAASPNGCPSPGETRSGSRAAQRDGRSAARVSLHVSSREAPMDTRKAPRLIEGPSRKLQSIPGPGMMARPPCPAQRLPAEAVEFSVLRTTKKCMPFSRGEPEHWARGVLGVAYADAAIGQAGDFNAVAVRKAQGTLDPGQTCLGWPFRTVPGSRTCHVLTS
jgi:hypothetical protein